MASVSEWGEETTGSEVAERYQNSIRGKTVVITGVSPKSLGESLAIAIARQSPARLILASRTKTKLEQVAAQIVGVYPDVEPILIELDLSIQEETRRAATEIQNLVDRVDILINNAAVVTSERQSTREGIELQFGTNHIGHFLFTSLLSPLLLNGARQSGIPGTTRVVNVTSAGYRLSPVRFHDYNFEGKPIPRHEEPPSGIPSHLKPDPAAGRPYQGFTAYAQSKTANILHAVSLNQNLGSEGVKAFAVHPGSIWTDLSRNLTPEDHKVIEGTSGFWKSQDQGVATILVAAFDPSLVESKGLVMLSDCQLHDVAGFAKDPKIAEHLWELSESLTAKRQWS